MVKSYYKSFYLNPIKDADLIEMIEQLEAKGHNISEICRQALRLYFDLTIENEDANKTLYRIIQLEKRLNDLIERHEKFVQEVLDFVNSKVAEFAEELENLKREISILKQAIEQKQQETPKKTEESQQDDGKALIEIIKKAFEEYKHLQKVLPALGYGEKQMKELEEVIKRAKDQGITDIEEILKKMKSEGVVFSPKPGFIQRV